MKTRINCSYSKVCNGNHCRTCELRNAPYDKFIAYQLKINSRKAKEDEENRLDLAQEIIRRKSIQG